MHWDLSTFQSIYPSGVVCDPRYLRLIRSQNNAVYCEKLLSIAQNDASRLEELQVHIKTLKKGVEVEQIGAEACDQLRRLLGLQEDALAAIYQQRILKSIRFDSMHERDDRVHLPHESTFNWLLEDDKTTDQEDFLTNSAGQLTITISKGPYKLPRAPLSAKHKTEVEDIAAMKLKSRTKYLHWLSSPEGIFHISGKLGSGKSTLMKLLYTHPKTRAQLQKWAGKFNFICLN